LHTPEVRRQALIKDGRPLIPAFLMAMTKGDAAAVPLERLSSSELEGTKRPITETPVI
jgi:hypothetical protein